MTESIISPPNNVNGSSALKGNSSTTASRRLEPLEVGWQFVQEYYTILNKDPNRLHCFYNKNSVMVHGYEGETIKPCQGQQEIHKRFKELNLQDSKVVISNVDSLGTLANGILVSVIGELETKGGSARKFVQSFVLAEQPNGFYVLNDVFRYLKDQFEDEISDNINATDVSAPLESSSVKEQLPRPEVPAISLTIVEEHKSSDLEPPLVQKDTVVTPQNGVAPAPVPDVPKQPAQPKTWAKLAEADKERWAIHVSETKGQTVPPAVSMGKTKKVENKDQRPKPESGSDGSVFIRGFSKATKISHIKETFADSVGTVKWVDLVTENSAFVEFSDPENVKKALDLKVVVVNGETVTIDDKRTFTGGNTRKTKKPQTSKSVANPQNLSKGPKEKTKK